MEIILWIIFGAGAGYLASWLLFEKGEENPFLSMFIGVIGALAGGLVLNFIGQPGIIGFNIYSLLIATLGAIILLAVVRALKA